MLGQLARRVKILASRAQALYSFIVALGNLFFKVLVMSNSEGILKQDHIFCEKTPFCAALRLFSGSVLRVGGAGGALAAAHIGAFAALIIARGQAFHLAAHF